MAQVLSISPALTQEHAKASIQQPTKKRRALELDVSDFTDNSTTRRRITRACDQCNQLRTKCNGQQPCTHCVENSMSCEYVRVHKKRGRVPKFPSEANANTSTVSPEYSSQEHVSKRNAPHTYSDVRLSKGRKSTKESHNTNFDDTIQSGTQAGIHNDIMIAVPANKHITPASTYALQSENTTLGMTSSDTFPIDLNSFQGFGFPFGDDYSLAFMGKAPIVESPDWLSLNRSMIPGGQHILPTNVSETIRYPVLLPLLPFIQNVLPHSLACDLLEQYFETSSYTCQRSKNPYIAVSLFRKWSMLHPTNPRECTPALLASILWISAQHSDASYLTSSPDARARACQKLLELTISMLKPLVHGCVTGSTAQLSHSLSAPIDTGLGGLVFPYDSIKDPASSRIQLDNIVTYIHLATVVSASERKAASLRWWNAAWSLAREVRLGRELAKSSHVEGSMADAPGGHPAQSSGGSAPRSSTSNQTAYSGGQIEHSFSEEDLEERRRVWWLLYINDRHLALCYNRPMFFLNQECEALLQPIDDEIWQSDMFDSLTLTDRRRGFDIRCTSHSLFGCLLPLMVILGEILDLNYARNRPRLGSRASKSRDWADATNEILQYLEEFEESVLDFESRGAQRLSSSPTSTAADRSCRMNGESFNSTGKSQTVDSCANSKPSEINEAQHLTSMVVAYSRHIMHVLHILLTGKFDPIALLDDSDFWISSESFVIATGHAVSAANELADVIEYDPDLSFMPYFFGIYLLQGSFLLLLFADKLKEAITTEVVQACETTVRAHEACVATLDTQYQRNFRKVMRSALQQLRGRIREDPTAQQNWRRGILQLYRWTGDGTGLAL